MHLDSQVLGYEYELPSGGAAVPSQRRLADNLARTSLEPRPRWPRSSPCSAPCVLIRGRRGARLQLHVSFLAERKHLPVVRLRRAA